MKQLEVLGVDCLRDGGSYIITTATGYFVIDNSIGTTTKGVVYRSNERYTHQGRVENTARIEQALHAYAKTCPKSEAKLVASALDLMVRAG